MTQRIDRLTPDQTARMAEWRDKWTNIGLSCEPLNVEAAKDAVRRAYAAANLPPPRRFVICDGPLSGAITAAALKSSRVSVGASVRDAVWASVGASVRVSVEDAVRDAVWDAVGVSVGASVRVSVRDAVRDAVRVSVEDAVWDAVWDAVGVSVGDAVWDAVWDAVYGAHDAGWLSFYDYFLKVCGLSCAEPLQPLIHLAQHCGWWIPYGDVCILQHRHCELHRDARGRLHNPHGPAVLYRDGWGVYAIHGVRLPMGKEWIITDPNRIDVAAIDAEQNAEVRRVMMDSFGAERYIVESGLQPVQSDAFGSLYRKPIPGDEELVMVQVMNSTPEPDGSRKHYWLRVDPNAYDGEAGRVAQAAVASTWRDEGGGLVFADWRDYAPVAES